MIQINSLKASRNGLLPYNKIRVPVNIKNVIENGIVNKEDEDLIVPYIDIDLPTSGIYKNQMMMLDILANNDWKRPIYFTGGVFLILNTYG